MVDNKTGSNLLSRSVVLSFRLIAMYYPSIVNCRGYAYSGRGIPFYFNKLTKMTQLLKIIAAAKEAARTPVN